MAMRIPSADVSIVDLTCRLEKGATYGRDLRRRQGRLPRARWPVSWSTSTTRSSPATSAPIAHTSIFDAKAGISLNPNFVKLVAWYDNEWGFSNKMLDLTAYIDSVRNK